MVTYVVVLLVVAAVLYGSFRALGGGGPVEVEQYRDLLRRLTDLTGQRAAELAAALERSRPLPAPIGSPPVAAADPVVVTAAEVRRALTGYRQQLDRIEVAPAAAEDLDVLASARTLLTAAIEDHGWACRLLEGGSHRENPGIQEAVAALRAHGGRCLAAVDDLLAGRAPVGV